MDIPPSLSPITLSCIAGEKKHVLLVVVHHARKCEAGMKINKAYHVQIYSNSVLYALILDMCTLIYK
jgi:hypothetical protein